MKLIDILFTHSLRESFRGYFIEVGLTLRRDGKGPPHELELLEDKKCFKGALNYFCHSRFGKFKLENPHVFFNDTSIGTPARLKRSFIKCSKPEPSITSELNAVPKIDFFNYPLIASVECNNLLLFR